MGIPVIWVKWFDPNSNVCVRFTFSLRAGMAYVPEYPVRSGSRAMRHGPRGVSLSPSPVRVQTGVFRAGNHRPELRRRCHGHLL